MYSEILSQMGWNFELLKFNNPPPPKKEQFNTIFNTNK